MNPSSTELPSPERIFARSVTPVIINSSPTPEQISDDSPLPSPLSLIENFTRERLGGSTTVSTPDETTDSKAILANRRERANRSISGGKGEGVRKSKATLSRRVSGDGIQSELQLTDTQGLVVSPKRAGVKETKAKRTKKSQAQVNRTLKGKVTKKGAKDSRSSVEETSAKLRDCIALVDEDVDTPKCEEEQGLQLEQAIKRRVDWTPTKDSLIPVIDLVDDESSSPGAEASPCKPQLGGFLSEYGFSGKSSSNESLIQQFPVDGPTKKRRVDLVKTNNGGSESRGNTLAKQPKPRTKRSQKTKFTTITSRSTALYGFLDPTLDEDSLKQSEKDSENVPTTAKGTRPGRKNCSKGKTLDDRPTFKVANPLEALRAFEEQELVFGTSSQLERDDSTNLDIDSHSALAESHAKSLGVSSVKPPSRDRSVRTTKVLSLSKLSSSKGLWSAGARDLTGSLAQIEVVNLVNPPDSLGQAHLSAPAPKSPSANLSQNAMYLEDDRVSKSLPGIKDASEKCQTEGIKNFSLGPRDNAVITTVSRGDPTDESSPSICLSKPNFRGFTAGELAKRIADFGFKPIKRKEQMIALLEKCWEDQHKSANSLDQNALQANSKPKSEQPAVQPASSKRTVASAKPRKNAGNPLATVSLSTATTSQARLQPKNLSVIPSVEDKAAENSDGEPNPRVYPSSHSDYTPRAKSAAAPSSCPSTPLTIRAGRPQASGSPLDDMSDLPSQITAAVKAQPRMRAINGIKQPTWYEKILMYDPIHLVDLTTWLNTEGLNHIGEDREVWPPLVREWCEGKGICCTYKKPLR